MKFLLVISVVVTICDSSYFLNERNGSDSQRILQIRQSPKNKVKDFKGKGYRAKTTASRLKRFISVIEKESPIPESFKRVPESKVQNFHAKYVIFSAAITAGVDIFDHEIEYFASTARKVGFDGDIVVAVRSSTEDYLWPVYLRKEYDLSIYNTMETADCVGERYDTKCSFYGLSQQLQINFMRYYLYRWWAMQYSTETLIMISDFRDVFFQSNPFLYKPEQWTPPVAQFTVFQEFHPNSVIGRCVFNRGWIIGCYGHEGLKKIGHKTVSCSGVSIGSRDAVVAYSYLLTQQIHEKVRLGPTATSRDYKKCISAGMDQGFHNWLLYSGILQRYMDVHIYQQGEGPVNTVGSFYGDRKLLKKSLEQWGVLKGKPPHRYIANWNGDYSPVVHQFDRYRRNLTMFIDAINPNYRGPPQ